ncbi:MAG: hypothetical protein IKG85_04370 [Clostridia bacterium]|nr:hypothetical protein [Clostridia bacterium]
MIWILLAMALIIGGSVISSVYNSKLKNDGRISERKKNFAEYKEVFSAHGISRDRLAEVFRSSEFRTNTKTEVTCSSESVSFRADGCFSAVLRTVQTADAESVFEFGFVDWVGSYGSPSFPNEMNALVTAVERVMLELDPATKISLTKNDLAEKKLLFR